MVNDLGGPFGEVDWAEVVVAAIADVVSEESFGCFLVSLCDENGDVI